MKSPKHDPAAAARPTPAAQYIRMSTEGQDLSPAVQRQSLGGYADRHDMRIVASYEDPGRSGLTLKARHSMRQLIRDVADDACPFDVILVYDVSRWGRFQETDASAYYEYHCRLHGVQVVYVNEIFSPDPSPMSALLKNLKRAMAAEYSRELGVKCRAGQSRAHLAGIPDGLPAMPGVQACCRVCGRRREAAAEPRRAQAVADRPGALGVRAGRRDRTGPHDLPALCHDEAVDAEDRGHPEWRGQAHGQGQAVHGRRAALTFRLRSLHRRLRVGTQGRENGIAAAASDPAISRGPASVPAIIDRTTWELVRRKRREPLLCRASDEEILHSLRQAFRTQHQLKERDLKALGCPSAATYRNRFGSFLAAAELALGERGGRGSEVRRRMASTRRLTARFIDDLLELLRAHGVNAVRLSQQCALLIEARTRIVVQVLWSAVSAAGHARWIIRKRDCGDCKYVLFLRMKDAHSAADFLLVAPDEYERSGWRCDTVPAVGVRLRSAQELLQALQPVTL